MFNFFSTKPSIRYKAELFDKLVKTVDINLTEVRIVYKLKRIRATNESLQKIITRVESRQFCSLAFMRENLKYIEDDFGDVIFCLIYELYLIISKDNSYKIIILFDDLQDGTLGTKLIKEIAVFPFCHSIFIDKIILFKK